MNGYLAFFNSKKIEIYAETLYEAKKKAVALFKPKKSQEHLVYVELAEVEGDQVTTHVD